MHSTVTRPASATRSRVGAFVALTKPRIIELLLVTTVPTQVVAYKGMPPLRLVVWTVLGGCDPPGPSSSSVARLVT